MIVRLLIYFEIHTKYLNVLNIDLFEYAFEMLNTVEYGHFLIILLISVLKVPGAGSSDLAQS